MVCAVCLSELLHGVCIVNEVLKKSIYIHMQPIQSVFKFVLYDFYYTLNKDISLPIPDLTIIHWSVV